VLGGSEFMGRTLIPMMLERGHDITTLNRGNEYWGTNVPFGLRVHRLACDRTDASTFSGILSHSGYWDAVVDFSAFDADDMKASVEGLVGVVGHYVYISTDSVYMVSRPPQHTGFRREDDAVRPESDSERKRLNKLDKYAHGKLQGEEVLEKAFRSSGFPFTSLRLPDVFGPYDTSDRHSRYQYWLQISDRFPVHLSADGCTRRLSFVYTVDVATAVLAVLEKGSPTFGLAFNIAASETPTLREYLDLTAAALGCAAHFAQVPVSPETCSGSESDSSSANLLEYFPSVDFGPIDTSKALAQLDWRPTPLAAALQATCVFFEDAWHRFPDQRARAIDDLPDDVRDELCKRKIAA